MQGWTVVLRVFFPFLWSVGFNECFSVGPFKTATKFFYSSVIWPSKHAQLFMSYWMRVFYPLKSRFLFWNVLQAAYICFISAAYISYWYGLLCRLQDPEGRLESWESCRIVLISWCHIVRGHLRKRTINLVLIFILRMTFALESQECIQRR